MSIYTYKDAMQVIGDILSGRAQMTEEFAYVLYDANRRLHAEEYDAEYGIAFSSLFMEYIFKPAERLFVRDINTGKWEPADKHIVNFIQTGLLYDYDEISLGEDLNGTAPLVLVEQFANHPADDYYTERIFMRIICSRANMFCVPWDPDVYDRTKNEIMNCPADYNKHRMTLLCMLMGEVMIVNGGGEEEEVRYLTDMYRGMWHILSQFYSVMTGKIIGSGNKHINAIIGNFIAHRPEYAWAMRLVLNCSRERLVRELGAEEEAHLRKFTARLDKAEGEVEQDRQCYNLFHIVFPRMEWQSYAEAAPRLTARQTQSMIEEKDRMLAGWKSKTEALERELGELRPFKEMAESMRSALYGNMISMDNLCEAILNYPAQVARELFGKLNWYLEGKDKAWDGVRLSLKQKIQRKEEEERAARATPATVIQRQVNYAQGAQHNDRSRHLSIDGAGHNDIKKLTGNE